MKGFVLRQFVLLIYVSVVVGIMLSRHFLHVESVFLMSACKHRRIVCKWFRKCCQPTKIKLVRWKNMIYSIDKTVVFDNRMENKDYFSRYKEALQSWRLIAATFFLDMILPNYELVLYTGFIINFKVIWQQRTNLTYSFYMSNPYALTLMSTLRITRSCLRID